LCDAAVGAFAFNRRASQYTTRRGQNQIECFGGMASAETLRDWHQ
jgi:hypothetical protein